MSENKPDVPQATQKIEPLRHGISKKRLVAAFAVAAVSDLLLVWLEFLPPVQWIIDGITALLLFILLGRRWAILPGLVAEAIPGVAVFPFWILVVVAIAVWGTIKPLEKQQPQP
jgi:hypothetical protein